jgi:ribosomal protein S4
MSLKHNTALDSGSYTTSESAYGQTRLKGHAKRDGGTVKTRKVKVKRGTALYAAAMREKRKQEWAAAQEDAFQQSLDAIPVGGKIRAKGAPQKQNRKHAPGPFHTL